MSFILAKQSVVEWNLAQKMKKCNKCQREHSYCEKHDAYYCKDCNIWLEKNCGDKTCEYCFNRPEKPSQVKENMKNEYKRTQQIQNEYKIKLQEVKIRWKKKRS